MKNKIYQSICLYLLAIVIGCTDNSLPIDEPNKDTITHSVNQLRSAGDGGFDLLGYGYDGDGEFANTLSAKAKVIDIEKIRDKIPGRIDAPLVRTQRSNFFGGEDYSAYTQKFSIKRDISGSGPIGNNLFSGSLNWAFDDSCSGYDKYSYASYDLLVQYKRLTLNADVTEIAKEYVTDEFRQDYRHLTPKALVYRYGNYVLRDIMVGAKLNVAYRSHASGSNREHTVKAGISAGVKNVFNISTNMSYTATDVRNNKNYIFSYRTIGGDPSKGLLPSINTDGTPGAINITPWQNSITLQNSQLIDIMNHGLIPLYKLIDDYDKRYDLMDYEYYDNEYIAREMLAYAIPLHKLSNDIGRVVVEKQARSDKIDISIRPRKIEKPNATIAFEFKNVTLHSDGSFDATDLKRAIITTCNGKKYTDVAKLTGKLIKEGDNYRIDFTLSATEIYNNVATFHSNDVLMLNTPDVPCSPELIAGTYIGYFYDIDMNGNPRDDMENIKIDITPQGDNSFKFFLHPFRVSSIPGKVSVDIYNLVLNTDGSFHAENVSHLNFHYFWTYHYPVTLIDGKFIPVNGGYKLLFTFETRAKFNGIEALRTRLQYDGDKHK